MRGHVPHATANGDRTHKQLARVKLGKELTMNDADRLLAECLKLEPTERARLIDELQATLPPDLGAVANEWPAEYHHEVVQRVLSVREGSAQLVSKDEFLTKLKS